jgi:hypothetical protein
LVFRLKKIKISKQKSSASPHTTLAGAHNPQGDLCYREETEQKKGIFFLSEEAQERGSIELSHKGLAH